MVHRFAECRGQALVPVNGVLPAQPACDLSVASGAHLQPLGVALFVAGVDIEGGEWNRGFTLVARAVVQVTAGNDQYPLIQGLLARHQQRVCFRRCRVQAKQCQDQDEAGGYQVFHDRLTSIAT